MKAFFAKNWIHFAAVAFMFIVAAIYFKPQMEGYGLKQHDVEQWKGMANETQQFRDKFDKEPLWTNSMFGGMPTIQITIKYAGNYISSIVAFYSDVIPGPLGVVLLHMLGFYIFALFMKINPVVGLIGAIAFSFASYEIIILQAGHNTKAMATAFMAPALGAFIHAYRSKSWIGVVFVGFFIALQLSVNHVQVTYYFGILLGFVGVYFAINSILKKELKSFAVITAGLLGIIALAALINSSNLLLSSDYLKHTIRGGNDITITPEGLPLKNQSTGLDKDYITQWSYGIGETFTLLSPNVKGGGSFVLGGSQFEDILDNSDVPPATIQELKKYPAYWGEQPFTSGPVYIGVVVFLLAFLGLIFLKSNIKWALFAITVLAIMLSWGKNFMGLTEFFIDTIPGYNKFRTVTIILVLVELSIPVLGALFLNELIKNREELRIKKNKLAIAVGTFFIFLLIVKMIGLGDGYSSSSDQNQMAGIEENYYDQIMGSDPKMMLEQYQLDINNPDQVKTFIDQQTKSVYDNFESLKSVREDIFNSSMNRSLGFTFFAGLLVLLLVFSSLPTLAVTFGLLILTMMDVIPVAHQYLGDQEQGSGYKYWEDASISEYPVITTAADEQILATEMAESPKLNAIVNKAEQEGRNKANELGYSGLSAQNVIDSYRFGALNFASNYRVFDLSGGFQSSHASYFHKSLGGYHGAKLRNINNLMDFHLSRMNNKVYDMLNVKYFIQNGEQGPTVRPNPTAMGNAWLVKKVELFDTPNDEIRALGSTFSIVNEGSGTLLVNGSISKEAMIYGSEKLQYLLPGKPDTLSVPLTNGMAEGLEALWVMDVNGKTNLIPMQTMEADTARSFLRLVKMKVVNEFKPMDEAIMLKSEGAKLSKKSFTGEGTVKMTSYAPNKITYDADLKGNQLVVFSEVYYNDGWKAFVDGKELPILKVNYLLRGTEIKGGKHKIELVFDLPKYHTGNTIAMIGSLVMFILVGAVFFFFFKRRKEQLEILK